MSLLDLIFPKHCLNCNTIDSYLCSQCLSTLQRHTQICIVCRQPSLWGATHSYCQLHSRINNLIIACNYKDTLRTAIHKIKYKYAYDIIEELCEKILVSEKIQQFISQTKIAYVTEIPSHYRKENARGFNLPTYVAKWIANHYQIKYQQFLAKNTATTPQASLHRKDRLFNVQNSFMIKNQEVANNAKILIVDDVLTTGSTLEEAAKTITQHAEHVFALVLASSK